MSRGGVKVLSTKPADLSLIPGTHMMREKTDSRLSTHLHMLTIAHIHMCMHMHIHMHMYVCMYIHICIYMYIHMHICIYMHIPKNVKAKPSPNCL